MLGSFLHLIILATARVTGQSSHFAKPQCSALTGPWCSCPSGTTLQQSTTWATLSADVKDVHAVAGRFLSTDWFGTTPDTVSGVDNSINCTRTMTDDLPFGPLSIVERLYGYRAYEDGSFSHVYGMDEPVEYHNGSFWGDWEVLDVKATRKGQTSIVWTIYACFTLEGGFDHFHESAINNITAILQREGKSAGYSVKPYSRNTAWPYFTLVQDVMGGPGLW